MHWRRSRSTLFRKYAGYFTALVTITLLASGLIGLFFAYNEARDLVQELQREKARGATLRIEQFARTIEDQLRAVLISVRRATDVTIDDRRLELLRLFQQAPAVIDVVWIDPAGRQLLKVSRVARDELGGPDWSAHPGVAAARRGEFYTSPVYFRSESEPYMTVAVGGVDGEAGVILADVNLKFVWGVVSAIQVGAEGSAYVIDATGRLIAHPDNSLVLRMTDLSGLPQVRSALGTPAGPGHDVSITSVSADGRQRATLSARASITALGWYVFVEQPLAEAFGPLYGLATRTGLLLVVGVTVAVAAALVLARRMTAPIETLRERATRIGEGRLHERVDIATGDELEVLANEFNRMAERLRESHDELETRIEARTRELAAANRAKSRFLAAASHDLRQPVHALGLFLAQLREARTPNERGRLLSKIEVCSRAVSELLDALLDVSKLDAGAVIPRPSEFGVQALLDRVEQDFAMAAQVKGLRLRVRPSPLRIVTDPVLLERILINLVANAVRYTSAGGVLVACRARETMARIEVWDTGIGIPLDQREQIFEEFHQAHPAVGEAARGLGLGLAIVRRLTGLLGITIDVRSREGRGSVFAVEVPRVAHLAPVTAVASSDPHVPTRFEGAVALVVDDDAVSRGAIAGLLAGWGWHVVSASSGTEALAALRCLPAPPDVLISDHRLAGGELGVPLIEQLQRACGRDVPAILVSGDISDEAQGAAQRAGLHALPKPLHAAKLRALLHSLQAEYAPADPAR